MQTADLLVYAVVVEWIVVIAHAVAVVLVLVVFVVVWAIAVLLIGTPQVTAMVVKTQAYCYYLWPPETSLLSDPLHRVLNA